MTPNPLDLIEARAQAATNGPWEAHLGHGAWMIQDDSCDDIATVHDRMGIDDDPQAEANAAFIINARQDVPVLVAALRAVEAVHHPMQYSAKRFICGHCQYEPRTVIEWPCPTITAIREALG